MKKILASMMVVAMIALMVMSAYAAFTPSAQSKAAPEIVTKDDVAATITDQNDQVVKDVGYAELIITPVAKKDEAKFQNITDHLDSAEVQIRRTDDLSDLTPDLTTALNIAKQNAPANDPIQDVDTDDLAVCDLFDVSYYVNGIESDIGEGNKITFTVRTKLTKDMLFFVLHNYTGDKWEVVDDVKLADNGDLTVTVNSLSPFSLVVDRLAYLGIEDVDPGTPVSPKTGETTNYVYLVGTIALLVCAAGICLKGTKRHAA